MIPARRRERARWRVAYLLNRLPWQCWPTLVGWALDGKRGHGSRPRLTGSTKDCRADADQTGACYCGKFRRATTGVPGTAGHDVCVLATPAHGKYRRIQAVALLVSGLGLLAVALVLSVVIA